MSYKDHVTRVRILYKAILRLHRGLPPQLQALGTQYVKEEFKQHKNCEPSLVPVFMKEWTVSAIFWMAEVVDDHLGLEQLKIRNRGFCPVHWWLENAIDTHP